MFTIQHVDVHVRICDEQTVEKLVQAIQHARSAELDVILHAVKTLGEKTMTTLSDLQAKVDKASADAQTAFSDGATKLDALAKQVSDLQAQIAAGQTVDPAELAAVSAELSTQSDALEAAAAAFEAKVSPAAPAPTT